MRRFVATGGPSPRGVVVDFATSACGWYNRMRVRASGRSPHCAGLRAGCRYFLLRPRLMKISHCAALVIAYVVCGCSRSAPVAEVSVAGGAAPIDLAAAQPAATDWPWWRGRAGNGIAADETVPTVWGEHQNVVWKSPVPGRGHSSPCVWGASIVLATADEATQVQSLLCFDRETGAPRWSTPIHTGGFEHAHPENSQASATPACDGERVFITFLNRGAIWVSAVDLNGQIVWQKEAGPFRTMHGYAASPALYKSLVIVAGDGDGQGFVTALHRKTGEIVWRVRRPGIASFSSPVVAHVAGRDQILLSGCRQVVSYDPASGAQLWRCDGPAKVTSATMAFDGDFAFVSGGYPEEETLCIRADGAGDVSASHVVWRNRQKFYVPSLVVHEGRVYGVSGGGIAWCFDAANGKPLWKHRLNGDVSASPVIAGNHVYVTNEAGLTHVFKTGAEFELVAENDLGDGGYATPVICGGRIYLRTVHALYCIGDQSVSPVESATATPGAPPADPSPVASEPGWGRLRGRFVYDGHAPRPEELTLSKDIEFCSKHHPVDQSLVVDSASRGLANVVLWLDVRKSDKPPAVHESYRNAADARIELNNSACQFAPRVALLRTSQKLVVGNHDDVAHSAAFFFNRNDPLNLVVPPQGSIEKSISLSENLPVVVGCPIHAWMKGWLLVKDHPYMAVTGSDGRFVIDHLASGPVRIRVWHELPGYLTAVKRNGQNEAWPQGVLHQAVHDGDNDLGEVHVDASVFRSPTQPD